jgi:hypothetical protein
MQLACCVVFYRPSLGWEGIVETLMMCISFALMVVCCPVLRKFWLIVCHNVTCVVTAVLIEYLVVQVWMPKDRQGRAKKKLSSPWLFH